MNSISQDAQCVNGESWGGARRLDDQPILVCTLQRGWFVLDLNKDEADWSNDYIPFQGEPVVAAPVRAVDEFGLEAIA